MKIPYSDWYLTGLDECLTTLPVHSRGDFLRNRRTSWERALSDWKARKEQGRPVPPDVEERDFHEILDGIDKRLANMDFQDILDGIDKRRSDHAAGAAFHQVSFFTDVFHRAVCSCGWELRSDDLSALESAAAVHDLEK